MPKVLLASPALQRYQGDFLKTLTSAGLEIVNPNLPRLLVEADLLALVPPCDAVIAGSEPYTAAVIARSPKLRIIARAGVGYDAVDLDAATKSGVAVTITPGANHHAVADFTMTLLLALARRLLQFDGIVRDGKWERFSPPSVKGATLGIVGFGRIGQSVAQRARGFEMRILAHDPYADADRARELDVELVDLEPLLRESDFVSLHCLVTDETRNLINRDTLALMKPTAYLINTARGELVDEDALSEALRSSRLAGAGLDVFAAEPLPKESPLRALNGKRSDVIFSPHIAGLDSLSFRLMTQMAAEAVIKVLSGGWPEEYVVNPEANNRVGSRC